MIEERAPILLLMFCCDCGKEHEAPMFSDKAYTLSLAEAGFFMSAEQGHLLIRMVCEECLRKAQTPKLVDEAKRILPKGKDPGATVKKTHVPIELRCVRAWQGCDALLSIEPNEDILAFGKSVSRTGWLLIVVSEQGAGKAVLAPICEKCKAEHLTEFERAMHKEALKQGRTKFEAYALDTSKPTSEE